MRKEARHTEGGRVGGREVKREGRRKRSFLPIGDCPKQIKEFTATFLCKSFEEN